MNKMEIQLSIIIPVYNCEQYVKKCLDSILSQIDKNIEVICVDDCSKDESLRILKEYKKNHEQIRVIKNEENLGLSGSRNRGLNEATGEYVWFVDADDWINNNAICSIVKTVNKYAPDILFFNAECVNEIDGSETVWDSGYAVDAFQVVKGSDFFCRAMKQKKSLSSAVWLRCYKRSLLVNNGLIFPLGVIHEDINHSLEALLFAEKVIVINEMLYCYRIRTESLSHSAKEDTNRIDSFCYILGRLIELISSVSEAELESCLRTFIGKFVWLINSRMHVIDSLDRKVICKSRTIYLDVCKCGWYGGYFPYLLSPEDMSRIRSAKRIVIYGAKTLAKKMFELLEDRKVNVDCFAVTGSQLEKSATGREIKPIEEISPDKETILLIAAEKESVQEEMLKYAINLGFSEKRILLYKDMVKI